MGIDVYMRWDGQDEDEREAQFTGFSVEAGQAGYLRESYFASPHYATHVLLPETFDEACFGEAVPEEEIGAFVVTEGPQYANHDLDRQPWIEIGELRRRLPAALETTAWRYEGNEEMIKTSQESLTAFVDLAEHKLGEGRRVWIYNSY